MQVKWRTYAVGSLPNEASSRRRIGAVFME